MVSSVSFRSTVASSFQDKIKQPQAFVKTDAAAATNLDGKEKKEKSIGSTVAKALIAAGVIVGGLVLGHKKGFFAVKEGGNALLNGIKEKLDVAGKFIVEKGGNLLAKFKKPATDAIS